MTEQPHAAGDAPAPRPAPASSKTNPRRRLLAGAGALATLAALPACSSTPGHVGDAAAGFKPVPPSTSDRPTLAAGHTATPLAAWGEPVGMAGAMPAFKPDAGNSASEQAAQIGMHHGGLQYVPQDGSRRGLLVMNHGDSDEGLLHPRGASGWSPEKVRKSQAAHGVSVLEVELKGESWMQVRPSKFARRITASSPVDIRGPAAGHALLKTAADPGGRHVLGALPRGGAALTPWGTCLMGEEGFAEYFRTADQPTAHERRYGLHASMGHRWQDYDERFDTVRHPQEANRFGWIVEVDPADPASTAVKRTALGRAAHAGAWVTSTADGRAVVYSGECAAFEYLYKFVSQDRIRPAGAGRTAAQANAELLDRGTLYVARFDADGSGRWLPLVHGGEVLHAGSGFADQAGVLVRARQASDALGGTRMDRPEGLAIDTTSGHVYVALAHNIMRGAAGHPAPDAANPRKINAMGHILRWRELEAKGGRGQGGDDAGFVWNHLLLAGDPTAARAEHRGTIKGDAFACPGALALDQRGRLWIGTGISSATLGKAEMAGLGNNQLLACNPANAEVRRFLTGPVNSELAGATFTPDGRTMFVNVQHPGESPGGQSDPAAPRRYSNWPDFKPDSRPRSATLAIRRTDGGVVGG